MTLVTHPIFCPLPFLQTKTDSRPDSERHCTALAQVLHLPTIPCCAPLEHKSGRSLRHFFFLFYFVWGAYLRWQLCIWLMRCGTRMRVPERALRLRGSAGLRCGLPPLLLVITRARAGKLTTTPIHRGGPWTKLAYKYVHSFPKCTHTLTQRYIYTNKWSMMKRYKVTADTFLICDMHACTYVSSLQPTHTHR